MQITNLLFITSKYSYIFIFYLKIEDAQMQYCIRMSWQKSPLVFLWHILIVISIEAISHYDTGQLWHANWTCSCLLESRDQGQTIAVPLASCKSKGNPLYVIGNIKKSNKALSFSILTTLMLLWKQSTVLKIVIFFGYSLFTNAFWVM